MRLFDALIRRKLPVGRDALDADAPDAYYPHPTIPFPEERCYTHGRPSYYDYEVTFHFAEFQLAKF